MYQHVAWCFISTMLACSVQSLTLKKWMLANMPSLDTLLACKAMRYLCDPCDIAYSACDIANSACAIAYSACDIAYSACDDHTSACDVLLQCGKAQMGHKVQVDMW